MKSSPKNVLYRVLCFAFALATVLGAVGFLAPSAEAASAPLLALYRSAASLPDGSVTLSVDGRTEEYSAAVGTVENLLAVAGVTLGEHDVVRPALSSELRPGMGVSVLRATASTATVTEVVPRGVIYQPNEYIPRGTQSVISAGADGERVVTYEIITVGGREISRRALSSVTTKDAEPQVIEYGPGGAILTDDGRVVQWSYKIDGNATAYTTEGYRQKHNATGNVAREGTVAVDPKVIPLGSELYVCSRDDVGVEWDYGECVAEDTGGAVKGNIVDLFFDTRAECYAFGRRYCTIYVLG